MLWRMADETYTHGHPASVLRSHRWRTAQNSAAYLLPRLHPGLDVLDVGCGPGTITIDLARIVGAGHATGVDRAAAVIEAARGPRRRPRWASRSPSRTCTTWTSRTPGSTSCTRTSCCSTSPIPSQPLREMARVCRPGGTIAVRDADYAAMSWWPLDARLDRWRELYRAAARANGGEPDAGRRLLGWVRAAGLVDPAPSASVWCFAVPEDRAWWSETWAERSTDSPLSRQLVSSAMATQAELDEIGTAWHEWARQPDGWFTVVHGEVLATVATRDPGNPAGVAPT